MKSYKINFYSKKKQILSINLITIVSIQLTSFLPILLKKLFAVIGIGKKKNTLTFFKFQNFIKKSSNANSFSTKKKISNVG